MRRKYLWVVLLVGLAVLAHWFFWYSPRERPGRPRADTVAGSLYFAGELPYRLWVPYPHQNLGRLEKAIDDVERFAQAVAQLSGREMPELPAFGSARVPPSSELAVASDDSGDRFVVVARVYPIAGFLARWAGRLAGNPLLAGGKAKIGGRDVEVQWSRGAWIVASHGVTLLQDSEGKTRDVALAWARFEEPRGDLPAGEYRLSRTAHALEIVAGTAEALEGLRPIDSTRPPVPLLMAELWGTTGRDAGRSLALLPGVESLAGLPGAVAVHRGERRWRLPGERVLELVGDGPPTTTAGRWTAVALDRGSLERGAPIAEFLSGLSGTPAAVSIWVDPSAARLLANQVSLALEVVPIVGRREARKWRALAVALEPLRGAGPLTAVVGENPTAVRLRLNLDPTRPPAETVD